MPKDNPFVGRNDAKPEIWSYGHRNSQGAALHPQTGKLWMHEHGPRGGDEINIPLAGKNYGWPVIGYGVDYSGTKIHEADRESPAWSSRSNTGCPSIAPSGMAFYTADLFPAWKGNLFVGALAAQLLVRLELDGEKVTREERLLTNLRERIRDVRQGPDGAIWLLTDSGNGKLLRVTPAANESPEVMCTIGVVTTRTDAALKAPPSRHEGSCRPSRALRRRASLRDPFASFDMFALFERLLRPTDITDTAEPPPG